MISEQTKPSVVTITATSKSGSIRRHELAPEKGVFVGRSSNCGLQLDGQDLSDIHCRFGFENGQVSIQDWMSSQGTKVNGEVITDSRTVGPGDVIEIGHHSITLVNGPMTGDREEKAVQQARPYGASQQSRPVTPSPQPAPPADPRIRS